MQNRDTPVRQSKPKQSQEESAADRPIGKVLRFCNKYSYSNNRTKLYRMSAVTETIGEYLTNAILVELEKMV